MNIKERINKPCKLYVDMSVLGRNGYYVRRDFIKETTYSFMEGDKLNRLGNVVREKHNKTEIFVFTRENSNTNTLTTNTNNMCDKPNMNQSNMFAHNISDIINEIVSNKGIIIKTRIENNKFIVDFKYNNKNQTAVQPLY